MTEQERDGISAEALAILAHEIRGALTAVAGFSELLGRPLSDADRSRALDGVRRAIERIDRLLSSAMSNTDAAGSAARIDLGALAERVVAEQRAISGRSISLEAEPGVEIEAAADPLERALGNLIDNALKYSLSNAEVLVRVRPEGGKALLEVLDRGPGISPDDAEKVFAPFERLGEPTQPGTGLGLTVVRSVAESHRGSARVDERPGGGSIFTIALPVAGSGG